MIEKEKKHSLELLAIVAIANLGLAFSVGVFCKVMAYVYPFIFGDDISPTGGIALVFYTFWWPWLLVLASCLCIIAGFRGMKAKILLISAFIILLTDILCLAITLLIVAALFAKPMWTLM